MADEIKARLTVIVEKGSFKETVSPGQIEIDQAAVGRYGGVQLIGSTSENIAKGDVTTEGCCFLQNLDATLNITYTLTGKLKPGEIAWFRLSPGSAFTAQNSGGSGDNAKLDVRLFED